MAKYNTSSEMRPFSDNVSIGNVLLQQSSLAYPSFALHLYPSTGMN